MFITMRLLLTLLALIAVASAFTTPRVVRPTISCRFSEETPQEATTPPPPPVKCPDCDLCDGSGRISGGLGAILPWLPIKAYRPCPNFIDKGGTYYRIGQSLDEIAFSGEKGSRN